MGAYLILLRGINVGGKNKVPMASLRTCLEDLGFEAVSTYIASGNALIQSKKSAKAIKAAIETALPKSFKLDSEDLKVAVLSHAQLKAVIANRPKGFGDEPKTYHSDALFLMGITAAKTMPLFSPRDGVDKLWPGKGVIYSRRLSAQRTKSRLSKIMGTPAYKAMTIRSWSTTTKLLELMDSR